MMLSARGLYCSPILRSFQRYSSIWISNPTTGKDVIELSSDTPSSVIEKAVAAREAQKEWMKVPLQTRKEAIEQYRDALSNSDTIRKFSKDTTQETGRPERQVAGEINGTIERINFFLNFIDDALKEKTYPSRGY